MIETRLQILQNAREGKLENSMSTSRQLQELAAMVDATLAIDAATLKMLDASRLKLALARIVNAWREFHAPCVEVERAMNAAQEVLKST